MPELPEVELTRRHLEPELVGFRVTAVDVRRSRMVRRQERPGDFAQRLQGRTIERLDRVGKFICATVAGDLIWVTHLGMSGRIQLTSPDSDEARHTNITIDLESGTQVRFVDPRTFGFMAVYTPEEFAGSTIARLGRDALSDLPSSAELGRLLGSRSVPIKALLLDQHLLAGLGNIYADEALFCAGIDPMRAGASLTVDEVGRLRRAIGPVLRAGIAAGGTSLADMAYLLPDGKAGEFMALLSVYGRTEQQCRVCATPIERTVIRGRSSHWCPRCQG